MRGAGDHAAFTLVELIVVVVIIGILASIGIPQYTKTIEKTRAGEALAVLGEVRAAQLRYRAISTSNVYTATQSDLDVEFTVFKDWETLSFTLTSAGTKGVSTLTRTVGLYDGKTIGLTYGTGKLCGTFDAYVPPSMATCTGD